MGYFGDWSNLQRNMERVKGNIESKKHIARKYVPKGIILSEAAKNRKQFSLVENRQKDIVKVRFIYLGILLIILTILYFAI